jgi:hypothetical protein
MSDDIAVIDGVFGKRYGEVLLVTVGESGPRATVYNTFPLNDCPAELWDALNAKAIAEKNRAVAALLNGPRYWLMGSIGKLHREALEHSTFGGLDMIRQATVQLASMSRAPYNVNQVTEKRCSHSTRAGRSMSSSTPTAGAGLCRHSARRSTRL